LVGCSSTCILEDSFTLLFDIEDPLLVGVDGFCCDNGCCGFMEKPYWMMRSSMIPPPEQHMKLTVKIISARQLPKIDNEVVDPFVAMFVKGWAEDQDRFTTKVVVNNGWDPRWDESREFILHAP